MSKPEQRGGSTLRVIAGFKFVEALLLAVGGCGALGLLNPNAMASIRDWLDQLSLHEGRQLTSDVASKALSILGTTSGHRMELIAIGCFVYATVFVVEGTGLWLRKRWAEYLTTLVTASLLPFEIVEVMHRQSTARVASLIVNVLVLVYLLWHLVRNNDGRAAPTSVGRARGDAR